MSKAILVIDMPKSCLECNFRRIENRGVWKGFSSCGLTKEIIWCDLSSKPIECPLRPLPEKKEELNLNTILKVVESKEEIFDGIFLSYMIDGYNACIDEIGGGANETDKETHQST